MRYHWSEVIAVYSIDKRQFGAFVAGLRKEKGWTQKELAERLFISDKAVSKWETGASIPDTSLLVPLAEQLGVTVTELLLGRRMESGEELSPGQVEEIVKTAVGRVGEDADALYRRTVLWRRIFAGVLLLSAAEMLWLYLRGGFPSPALPVVVIAAGICGLYFCFFARTALPAYYDENPVHTFSDGVFRMNVPGLTFHNGNWPHILTACRIWAAAVVTGLPLLCLAAAALFPILWTRAERIVTVVLPLAGLLAAVYLPGKRYE